MAIAPVLRGPCAPCEAPSELTGFGRNFLLRFLGSIMDGRAGGERERGLAKLSALAEG